MFPDLREEISARSDILPDLREQILTVFGSEECKNASKRKLGKQCVALRPNFPLGFRVLLGVDREVVAKNSWFLCAEYAFATVAIHLCDGGG